MGRKRLGRATFPAAFFPLAKSIGVEGFDDRAGALRPGRAGRAKSLQSAPCLPEILDSGIELGQAHGRDLPNAGTVIGPVEGKKLADLGKGEAGSLGGTDEPKAPNIVFAVAADLAMRPRRFGKQAATLVIADSFDTDARGFRKPADRV
jgi:hypothetical protein